MSEYTENKIGQIQIADEVIAIIAATAATEVDGVITYSNAAETLVGRFGKKILAKGVKVTIEEGEAAIEMEIGVKMGGNLLQMAKDVQSKVKNAVETMTGLEVSAVHVNIAGVMMEKAKQKEEDE